MRGLAVLLALILAAACSTKLGKDGRSDTMVDVKYLAKTEVDRIADTNRAEVVDGLLLIADKLYKRNPKEWKKAGQVSREVAVERLRNRHFQRWPEMNGLREGPAAALAFNDAYAGDRVAAFIHATADMIITAHGGKTEFFLLDGMDAQHLYNAARNVETAVWLLAQRRNAQGQPLLLADEIGAQGRNLSFEREFGKIIARLDLLAAFTTEKYRRAAISYVQGIVGGTFLQFLPVR